MDKSREIESLRMRMTKLIYRASMPDLEMPVFFEGEEPPKQYGAKLPNGKVIPLTLPIMIEKKRPL